MHADIAGQEDYDVEQHGDDLPDDGRDGRTAHAECRQTKPAENQDGIEHDIDNTAARHEHHGGFHAPNALKDLLKAHLQQLAERQAHNDIGVITRPRQRACIVGEHAQERSGEHHTCDNEDHTMDEHEQHAQRSCSISLFALPCAKMHGHDRANAYTYTHADRHDSILQWKSQRYCGQCIGAQFGDPDTVDDVVERLNEHGQHNRDGHGNQQSKYRFSSHKFLFFVHFYPFLHKKIAFPAC